MVFDVSHLGTLRCAWRGSGRRVAVGADQRPAVASQPGRAQYTHLLDELDAHVIDDLIVWWLAPDELLVMPNASNTQPLVDRAARRVRRVRLRRRHGRRRDRRARGARGAGSRARARLLAPIATEAADVARFHVQPFSWQGADCVAAGTGYTGEDGVEIQVPADRAPELWDAIVAAGVLPAGLGARDTLRLEAGLPLHGHELGAGITPLQAGLGWVVRFDKGDFRGQRAPRSRT